MAPITMGPRAAPNLGPWRALHRGVLVALAATCWACAAPAEPPASPGAAAPDRWVGESDPSARSAGPAAASPGAPDAPRDFAAEARLLFRVVACAGDAELPREIDARVVEDHCAELGPKLRAYKTRYVAVAKPFLAKLVPPAPLPVVYPFAGGDLVTALTTFPDAPEYTTLSLELAGDPRRVTSLGRQRLDESLAKLRDELDELIGFDDYSKSETLKRTQRGDIPDELAFFFVSLAVHDLEPVKMRYFDVQPDGSLHYLSEAEIGVVEDRLAQQKKGTWWPPDFSEAFANVEIGFRAKGAGPSAAERVHRHLAVNLADDHLRVTPGVLRHLEAKPRFYAMTKAASYLLWNDGFSTVRTELLDHMTLMVSDSTGIPPAFASGAGFIQETYGTFRASLLRAPAQHNAAFKKLWDGQPKRSLPFRYGYKDKSGHDHLVVTKKRDAGGG